MEMIENFNPSLAHSRNVIDKTSKIQQIHSLPRGFSFTMITEKPKKIKNLRLLSIVILLFFFASIFQTVAWYFNVDGKYKFGFGLVISLTLVFFEYMCLTRANSWGYQMFSLFQIGLLAEIINWIVFLAYIKLYQKEEIEPKMWFSLLIMSIAIYIAYV